jgi:hypothetical protein
MEIRVLALISARFFNAFMFLELMYRELAKYAS